MSRLTYNDMARLESHIVLTPDFPEPGVVFRDISALLEKDFQAVVQCMEDLIPQNLIDEIDNFAGLDARGFIFAGALAEHFNKGALMIRKAGKLPPPVHTVEYGREYGKATLALKSGAGKTFILDDVLASGGSMTAAADLCTKAGYKVVGMATLIDLPYVRGQAEFEWNDLKSPSVFVYHNPYQVLYPPQ